MREIISEPESPWNGFRRGALYAFGGAGLSLLLGVLFLPGEAKLWLRLEVGFGACLVVSVVGGVGMAVWRIIQGAAYRRFIEGP